MLSHEYESCYRTLETSVFANESTRVREYEIEYRDEEMHHQREELQEEREEHLKDGRDGIHRISISKTS